MSRPQDETEEGLPGQDSFLDIVANMVGILVILVMVVGVRAAQSTPAPSPEAAVSGESATPAETLATGATRSDAEQLARELDATVRDLKRSQSEIEQAVVQVVNLRRESELVDARRLELNMVRAQIEQDLSDRRGKLDDVSQSVYDVQREITQTHIKLDELTQEQISYVQQPGEVEEVESVPTPLAQTITGDEIHTRLRGGRLAVIPVDELLDEVRYGPGLDYLRSQVTNGGEGVDVFGPIDGFRMRLSLQVYVESLPGASPMLAQQRRSLEQVAEFLPTSSQVGEPIEQALLPDSGFMKAVRRPRSQRPAVVVWIYPDSFGDLRILKRAMWELSIPMAVRPLDADDVITFSTRGTKSQAQ
jgi:hypothetical protein